MPPEALVYHDPRQPRLEGRCLPQLVVPLPPEQVAVVHHVVRLLGPHQGAGDAEEPFPSQVEACVEVGARRSHRSPRPPRSCRTRPRCRPARANGSSSRRSDARQMRGLGLMLHRTRDPIGRRSTTAAVKVCRSIGHEGADWLFRVRFDRSIGLPGTGGRNTRPSRASRPDLSVETQQRTGSCVNRPDRSAPAPSEPPHQASSGRQSTAMGPSRSRSAGVRAVRSTMTPPSSSTLRTRWPSSMRTNVGPRQVSQPRPW